MLRRLGLLSLLCVASACHRAAPADVPAKSAATNPGLPTAPSHHPSRPPPIEPLAVCDARSVAPEDLVVTDIHHFGEDDLAVPRHRGQIYSVRYNAAHRWFYASNMQPDEFLLLKCYDSRADGRARFMPHTGFRNPTCPSEFVPRESIEARALVIFGESA